MIIHRHTRLDYRLIAFLAVTHYLYLKIRLSPETGKVLKVQSINSNDFDITFASINVNTNWSVQQTPHYTVTLKIFKSFYNYEKETSNLFF